MNIFAGMISLYGMNIAINHFFGTLLNAALGIATQLQGALMGVSVNMSKALTPVLVKKEGANQRLQMLEISYAGCKFSFLLFLCTSYIVLNACCFAIVVKERTRMDCSILCAMVHIRTC